MELLRSGDTSTGTNPHAPLILVVDAAIARRRSLAAVLRGLGHRFLEASTFEQAIQAVQSRQISLVLLDLMAPNMGGLAFCQAVRSSLDKSLLPIIAIGRRGHIQDEVLAMEAGADLFLPHDVDPRPLHAAIQGCLRRKAAVDALDETETVLFTLAQSVEQRDPALGQHCERLALMSATMGVAIGLDANHVLTLQRGGYLHDVGKVAIPDSVLFKPGPLTDEEWVVMKSHTERGERICRNVRSLAPVLPIIRNHHERWDGSGYPDGLKGEEIPLLARIIQITDIYDALTTPRPYKPAYTPAEAIAIMQQETDRGWRDPRLMTTFVELLPLFSTPEKLELPECTLQALASAIQRYRREPARAESVPVKMVSGL